jgi:hypothetical protein
VIGAVVGPWAALLLLGAVHGANPGMGWLFAVALGLQEGSGRAVWRALPPLMIGHALAVAAALALAVAVGLVVPPVALRWGVAVCLVAVGVFHLVRHRHPRFTGMRVGARQLIVWSCLMASAHGAGLMAVPFVPTGMDAAAHDVVDPTAAAGLVHHAHGHHGAHGDPDPAVLRASMAGGWLALVATLVHTLGYLLVTGALAALVYYRLGLRLLRRAWINVDRLWAGALVLTAVFLVVV